MAIATLSNLSTAISQGARPNQFSVSISGPSALTPVFSISNVLCKAAALPGYTIGVIEVPFRGRRVKLPGDRTFGEWTATFLVDENMNIRRSFEAWMRAIKTNDFNAATAPTGIDYFGTVNIKQLNSSATEVGGTGTVALVNAFPTDISAIDLSFDTTDAIEEFTVTFQYSYHT